MVMAATAKNAVLCDMTLRRAVDQYQNFGRNMLASFFIYSEDVGSRICQNISNYLPEYTASHCKIL